MEENSDAHMETDVSSTTDDAVDTQEVTGSNGQVEMTITVEKVNEEEATSNLKNNAQIDIGNNVSSDPTAREKSPLKELSKSTAQKSPNKNNEASKPNLESPTKTESPLKVTSIISPVKNTIQKSSIERKDLSADISTKIGFLTSPSKDKNGSKEKNYKECDVQKTAPVSKKTPIIFDIDVEEKITVATPIEVNKVQTSLILKSPSKENVVDKKPINKDEELKKNVHVDIHINKHPCIKSPPIKLVRKTPNTELKLNDTTTKETKVNGTTIKETKVHGSTIKEKISSQEATKPSTSKQDSTLQTTNVNGETNSSTPSQKEVLPEPPSLPCAGIPMDVIEAEVSNDSQLSTASERDHNKSISRELKSLINSAKESKIISECTQLTSKTRKSRTNLDTSLNMSVGAEITQDDKRDSQASQESEKPSLKRSMRSQNPDFVTKCKQFLNSVTSKVRKDSDGTQSDSEPEESRSKQKCEPLAEAANSTESSPKKKKVETVEDKTMFSKLRSDPFCWRCHWQLEAEPNEKQPVHPPMHCSVCVRSFHSKCMTVVERKVSSEKNWVCPDCLQILHAESSETRSPAMKKISLGMLCDLLKFGLERMEALNGVEPFLHPVDRTEFPDYDKIVVHPMDLTQIRQNITDGHYGSTEAFIADAQWILHNSILFNACEQTFTQSKLTAAARALVRTCRAEMVEIETCPECYAGAHSRNLTYFTEVCSTPHMILWAKLKGFPFWPAKAVAVNNGMVDVRFFGQHDKSWVPVRDCYLYSEKDPNTTKHKKLELIQCRQEAEVHIRNICRKYGSFVYAPFKTMLDLNKMTEQLKMMIPSFTGEIIAGNEKNAAPVAKARWSISKSRKTSNNDGDISESDDPSTKSTSSRKSSGDLATREAKGNQETDTSISEKDIKMVVDVSQTPPRTPVRKRRRSTFPETTPIAESTALKKQKVDETSEMIPNQAISKDDKSELIKHAEAEIEAIIMKAELSKKAKEVKTVVDKVPDEKDKPVSSQEQEIHRVTPIKLVALPRANKQTPKIFTTAKVIKSNPSSPAIPSTPVDEEKYLNTSSSKRSKVTKADRFIMTEQKESKDKSSRRNSRNNRSSTSTSKHEKTDKSADNKSVENKKHEDNKKSDSGSDASTSKERSARKKDNVDRSLLKKDPDTSKSVKDIPQETKKTDDNLSLAVISVENKNTEKTNISGLPTISNVVSLSTSEKANTTDTNTTTKSTATKTIEITVEANPNSSIFTPTSFGNVGNMKEAVSKLQKLRSETTAEPFVGRVGVKAFARMTSPDVNDDVEVKTEPVDLNEMEEDRQTEKMDLMNACKLQPVSQAQSLRDVRINKVIITPTIMVRKPAAKVPEPRPRAKKTFPQPKRPEGGELNGKNSMVYIPIQPPMTQPPAKSTKSGPTGITMPANVTAGPRISAHVVSSNSIVNTVTTPLRPITSTLSSPPATVSASPASVAQVSTVSQVPTVGPATVHTVPLMTSVNGQWMFSLQPVMSVGGVDNTSSPPMVNGITERPGTTLVPVSSSVNTVMPTTPANRNHAQSTRSSPAFLDNNGTPKEMPRLLQRPLMSPFDANTPIGSVPPPSTAGPLTAKLNQNAVKLTDFFRTLLEDSIEKLDEPVVQVTALKVQLEQMRWRHQQSLDEIKHNNELTLTEMRQSFEKEKQRIISETRRAAQIELEAAVKEAKDKQWCANCFQEAQFYCCWNTSYCDHQCQRTHWDAHFGKCTQEKTFLQLQEIQREREERLRRVGSNSNATPTAANTIITQLIGRDGNRPPSSHYQLPKLRPRDQRTSSNKTIIEIGEQRPREQQTLRSPTPRDSVENAELRSRIQKETSDPKHQGDNPPKSVPPQTPCLTTIGGKPAPMRVFTDSSGTQKTSIIVSMIEDTSGNQTLKCVGTYKASAQAQAATQMSSHLINKQKNDDSAAKKTVTSGGYLIVGASGTTTSVITPAAAARRSHVQYFS